MKTILFLLILALPAFAQSTKKPNADEVRIRQIIQEQQDGWNRGSAKDYAASFQAEGSFTIITGTIYRSRTALEARMVEIFSTIYKDSKVANRIQTIRFIRPDVAVVDLETEVTGFQGLPSGVKGAGQNKLLTSMLQVMVKERGKWAVAAFHNVDVKTR